MKRLLMMGAVAGAIAAGGVPLTPDVWDRLEADRRQALEDDVAWIRAGRGESLKS